MSFSAVIHECKVLGLQHLSGNRIEIVMRNQKAKDIDLQNLLVAEFQPKHQVMVYSVPEGIDPDAVSAITL